MKYYKSLIITVIFGSILSSCTKSFLSVQDNTLTLNVLRQEYVTDLKTSQQFVNGIYAVLSQNFYFGPYQIYPDLIADNIKPVNAYSDIPNMLPLYNWQQDRNNNSNELWKTGYQLIRSCNFVISKVGELANENPEIASQLQGEVYGIRALVHFVLVNTFAQSYNFTSEGNHLGIPYITSVDWKDPYYRNTVAEVYSGMINDLKKAISLLPPTVNTPLVMNHYASQALLARVYLFKEDWQQAKIIAADVAISVPMMVNTPIRKMYPDSLFRKGETEALFQLAPSATQLLSNGYDTYFQGRYLANERFAFLATQDIANLLTQNPNDSRAVWIKSGGIGKDSIRKYPRNVIPGFGSTATDQARSYYQTLLRSSEMVLTVAEASAKIGDENTARTYIDAVRQRADPSATKSTVTGEALLDLIYTERRKELAFEGIRMFDLLRWKKGVNRVDISNGAPTLLPYPNERAIAPIPYTDTQYGIPQNAGY